MTREYVIVICASVDYLGRNQSLLSFARKNTCGAGNPSGVPTARGLHNPGIDEDVP